MQNHDKRTKLLNILEQQYQLNSLMQILDKFFECEKDFCSSIVDAQVLYSYINKKHRKITDRLDKFIAEYSDYLK